MPSLSVISKLTTRCETCPSHANGICCGLSDAELQSLRGLMRHRTFEAGQQILRQDDVSDIFAVIISGTVKLTRLLPDGREQIVGLLGEADCIGGLFDGAFSRNTAQCITETVLCCFPRDRFEAMLDTNSGLERRLLTLAIRDLEQARDWLVALGRKSATEKVATFLLWLLDTQQRQLNAHASSESVVDLMLSRQEIGDFLGLTVETVSRQMTRLRSAGAIAIRHNHQVAIVDLTKLRRIAEGDC